MLDEVLEENVCEVVESDQRHTLKSEAARLQRVDSCLKLIHEETEHVDFIAVPTGELRKIKSHARSLEQAQKSPLGAIA
jgi:hypothetical protein